MSYLINMFGNILNKPRRANPIQFNRNFPYGRGCTERIIEIPWALSQYNSEKRVLEVGGSHAEQEYIRELKRLRIPALHCIDISEKDAPDFIKRTADIRDSGFPDSYFNMILCISTIEHIGMDNTKYYSPAKEIQNTENLSPDAHAILEMWRILKKDGKLIITVPFGKLYNYGWFKHYDSESFSRLIGFIKYKALIKEFFIYTPEGWNVCEESVLKDILYQDNGAPAAAGLCCCVLMK